MTRRDWMLTMMTPLLRDDEVVTALPGIALLRVAGQTATGREMVAFLPNTVRGWVLRQDAAGRNYAMIVLVPLTPQDIWGDREVRVTSAEVLWDACAVGRVTREEAYGDAGRIPRPAGTIPTVRIPLDATSLFQMP